MPEAVSRGAFSGVEASARTLRIQPSGEPGDGPSGDLGQCACLFEEVPGARNNGNLARTGQLLSCSLVEVENRFVATADNEEDRYRHLGETGPGQIGAAPATDDRRNRSVDAGQDGGRSTGARPEQPHRNAGCGGRVDHPVDG